MVLRVTFFALMAFGLLGLGFIAYAATRPPAQANNAPPPPVTTRVLTVATDITAGNLLKPGDIGSKEEPPRSGGRHGTSQPGRGRTHPSSGRAAAGRPRVPGRGAER